ncbi:MAG: isoprenyl transferase [Bacteroidia bacterium]|nr:isoprenyl transferase [Bacteroidia bacterium]
MSLVNTIDRNNVPQHIAVIMDGNGRWAKQQGKFRVFGHKHGVKSVREVTEGAAELGVKYLTLYAFSTENWNRPKLEIDALMTLMVKTIKSETDTLMKNNIRLSTIGQTENLPNDCKEELKQAMELTKDNTHMTLILALSYSSKWDIVDSVKKIATQYKSGDINLEDINEELISNTLATKHFPDPDLMIRTSGEQRISNYLLWELAYSEFYFTDVLWPDFRKEHLHAAIANYQQRERRFGKTGEQVAKNKS